MSNELPILNQVSIPEPCPASWDAMTGDEQRRHCSQCDKTVFHLSNMSADEAERVVTEHAGNLCARIRVRKSDGQILTAESQPVVSRWRRLVYKATAVVAAIPILLFAGCADDAGGRSSSWFATPDEEVAELGGVVCPQEFQELQGDVVAPEELMGKVTPPQDPVE